MPILTLDKLWLNRMDTGEAISGASARDRATGYSMEGTVRTYASGRRRAITTAGLRVEVQRRMVALDFDTKEQLVEWLGVHCQLRDHRGNKWFGVFFAVDIGEYMRPDLYSAAITLQAVTTVEGL
jgi:hypothetical protein